MQERSSIEQLWYTWAPRGMELIRGFQVYAASSALMDVSGASFKAINPYLGYSLPTGTDRLNATKENSPFCLAYVQVGNERLLLHKNFSGSDTAGRIGTYFIHLLAYLPTDFTARNAIDLWHSDFWRKAIPDSTAEFKDPNRYELWSVASNKLVPGDLTEREIQRDGRLTRYLPFVIEAFLTLTGKQKLIIAAEDYLVATLIWGMTHCLPQTMLRDLTFSTYEADPSKATTRIVGTCLPAEEVRRESMNAERLLPVDDYTGQYIALNCYTGQQSPLTRQNSLLAQYAQFAATSLLGHENEKNKLLGLFASAERQSVRTTDDLLVVYKFFDADNQPQNLSPKEISSLLTNDAMAIEYLRLDGVQDAVIALAIQNRQWWNEQGKAAITSLRNNPFRQSLVPTLTDFACRLAQKVADAIIHKDQEVLNITYDLLQTTAPAQSNPKPWLVLLSALSGNRPDALFTWQFRVMLLKQWKYGKGDIRPEQIAPWLSISWEQLQEIFSLDLPQRWQAMALHQLLSDPTQPMPPQMVKVIERPQYQPIFMRVLKDMYESQQKTVMNIFNILVKSGYSQKLDLLYLFLDSQMVSAEMMEELLKTARLNTQEKLTIFERYAEKLLSCNATSLLPSVEDMVKLYVDQFTVKTLFSANAESMLTLLQQHRKKLSPDLQQRVFRRYLAGQAICFSRREPLPDTFDELYLNRIGKAIYTLQLTADKQYMGYLYYTMMQTVWGATNKEERLLQLLEGLRTLLKSPSRPVLLSRLIEYLGQFDIPPEQLLPYIKIVLDFTLLFPTPEAQGEYLFPLFKILQKNIRAALDVIDAEANNRWPPNLRNLWQQASINSGIRPKGFMPTWLPWRKQGSTQMDSIKADVREQKAGTSEPSIKSKPNSQSSLQTQQEVVQPLHEQTMKKSQNSSEQALQATNDSKKLEPSQSHEAHSGNSTDRFAQSDMEDSPSLAEGNSSLTTSTVSFEQKDISRINGKSPAYPITKPQLERACDIKQSYIQSINELITVLSQQEATDNTPRAGALIEENIELQKQKENRKYMFCRVQEEMVEDMFIRDWIDRYDEEHKRERNKFMKDNLAPMIKMNKNNKDITQPYNEDILESVLDIFLRRYYAIKQMSETDWKHFIKEPRERAIIEYTGKIWQSDPD